MNYLLALLLGTIGIACVAGTCDEHPLENVAPSPRYIVILWDEQGDGKIAKQGTLSWSAFKKRFLSDWNDNGEYMDHSDKDDSAGVLIAQGRHTAVAVPISMSKDENGDTTFLCRASVDGSPPAFSVVADSQKDLLVQIEKLLSIKDP